MDYKLRKRSFSQGRLGTTSRYLIYIPQIAGSTPSVYMGKGITDSAGNKMVFGALFGDPSVEIIFDTEPTIFQPTLTFDISDITPGHEIVTNLVRFTALRSKLTIKQIWYRNRDNKELFTFSFDIPSPSSYGYESWSWYTTFSWIGYCPWEIWEDGAYHCDTVIDGSVAVTKQFSVSGFKNYKVYSSDAQNITKIKVSNLSTSNGAATSARFGINLDLTTTKENIISINKSLNMGAAASEEESWTFNVPGNQTGYAGTEKAELTDPSGNIISSASRIIAVI